MRAASGKLLVAENGSGKISVITVNGSIYSDAETIEREIGWHVPVVRLKARRNE